MKTTTYLYAAALFAGVLLLAGCDTPFTLGPGAASASAKNLRAVYHTGSCYGRCEVMTLELYANGLMLYKGERFTDRPGVWEKNIDRRRMTGILDSFAQANFSEYPVTFQSMIPDAPSIEMTWYDDNGQAYTTSFKETAPPELEQLSIQMRRLAQLPDWKQVSVDIPDGKVVPVANRAREEIIVQLVEGVRAETWLVNYGKQNVQFVRRMSPSSNYYLITADPNIMGAKELVEFLRRDEAVLGAQVNGTAGERD